MNINTDSEFVAANHDHSDGDTLTTGKRQLLRGAFVIEAPDQDFDVYDGSGGTQVGVIPANSGAGTWIEFGEVKCVDGVYTVVNSATSGTVSYRVKKYAKGA